MLARGYTGTLPLLHATTWSATSAVQLGVLVTLAAAVSVIARLG
jgi:hypothetical protein